MTKRDRAILVEALTEPLTPELVRQYLNRNKPSMKFRIVYTVVSDLDSKTRRTAFRECDAISDDIPEFCAAAVSRENVTAKLQQFVKGEWIDVGII